MASGYNIGKLKCKELHFFMRKLQHGWNTGLGILFPSFRFLVNQTHQLWHIFGGMLTLSFSYHLQESVLTWRLLGTEGKALLTLNSPFSTSYLYTFSLPSPLGQLETNKQMKKQVESNLSTVVCKPWIWLKCCHSTVGEIHLLQAFTLSLVANRGVL